ncbi:cyclophilin [Candidatus Collierbacteria bacterium RIFOXYD1_FULL_40_9]|uniref:Peptidyl-prolyl cis-trans isomerase n=1 Tax=Candidatus Collierbacteria bacterium RIFOXYD1_FULL_40_9 TaxID=1817731 RepID=A0A1F5FW26_9BACT|nr:MAG: cyclophilin [Candidatus Collierbacteria bacterium RIFOXYD1_FULL_40_9]
MPQKTQGNIAILKTSLGDITIELFPESAPETVSNFVGLAQGTKEWTDPATGKVVTGKSLYAGTIFHRVIENFMIQGGDPLGKGIGGPGYKFKDEIDPNLKFDKPYLLAMANSGPATNGSQFFITVIETPWLNGKHTIFGQVTSGQDVVDKIVTTKTGPADKPLVDVVLKSIEIKEK